MKNVDSEDVFLTGWMHVLDAVRDKQHQDQLEWQSKFCALFKGPRKLTLYDADGSDDVFEDLPQEVESKKDEIFSSRSSGAGTRSISAAGSKALKAFLAKKLIVSLKRNRTASKVSQKDKQEQQGSASGKPIRLTAWKSHESLLICNEETEVDSIDIPLRGWTVVRPVHASVLAKEHCFQITTPVETKYFTCASTYDTQNWIAGLKEVLHPTRDLEYRTDLSLEVWVVEAKGLPSKRRYYAEVVLDRVLYARTSTKLKGEMLFWGEQFLFGDLPNVNSLTVHVFRENEGKKRKKERSLFVGSVEVSLDSIPTNKEYEKWFPMVVPLTSSPRPSAKNAGDSKSETPSLRMKLKYHSVSILPMIVYGELHDYVKQCYLQLCKELEPVISIKAKDQLAQTLLKVLQADGLAKKFLVDIIVKEVTDLENENLTFRGNTVATKAIDTYMKMVGKTYLNETLGPFVNKMYSFDGDCEVDPSKTSPANVIENKKTLSEFIELAWSHIISSHNSFPSDLQETFHLIRQGCEKAGKTVGMKLISASVFLRFLCPAILSPSLFHLIQEYPNEKVARALTLIAKTIQNLANFTRFGSKEEYMESLNGFVEKEMANMKHFLNMISLPPQESEVSRYDGYIDQGKELAVLSNILAEDVEKLPEDALVRLGPLGYILDALKEATAEQDEFCGQAKKQLKVFDKARAQRTRSAPFVPVGGGRKISLPSNDSLRMKGIVYSDSLLSGTDDYVSGCTLISHTRIERPFARDKRTMGRARAKTLANTPSRVNPIDPKMYKEIQNMLINTANTEYNFDYQSNKYRSSKFVRSSSFSGTSSTSSLSSNGSNPSSPTNWIGRPKAGTLPGARQTDTYFRGIKDPRLQHPDEAEEQRVHKKLSRDSGIPVRSSASIQPRLNFAPDAATGLKISLCPQLSTGSESSDISCPQTPTTPSFQISLSPALKRGPNLKTDLVISNFSSMDSRSNASSVCSSGNASPSPMAEIEAAMKFFDNWEPTPRTYYDYGKGETNSITACPSQERPQAESNHVSRELKLPIKQKSHEARMSGLVLNEMERKFTEYETTIAELKLKYTDSLTSYDQLKDERDEQMRAIVERLMFVEAELKKEQLETDKVIKDKEQTIDAQQQRIRSLELANVRLVNAMSQLREEFYNLDISNETNYTIDASSQQGNNVILRQIEHDSNEQEV